MSVAKFQEVGGPQEIQNQKMSIYKYWILSIWYCSAVQSW